MNKKFIFLFIALILPGLIFIFLKQFGKNEFAIPVFYQRGVDSVNSVCATNYAQPYTIPDSVMTKSRWNAGQSSLFLFETGLRKNSEFKRLADSFDSTSYQVVEIDPSKLSAPVFQRWCSCVFMIKPPWNAVLIDEQKRIRGYYAIGSREETDRLIMEMQILFRKY